MRLPTVSCQVTGCVDAVRHGKTGLLVPVRDVDALTTAITAYLRAPEIRRAHGHAGRAWVESQFQPRAIWQAIDAEYRELLDHYCVEWQPRNLISKQAA
jgi:glycosyltransferase involved in cell wall biosynthesis